MVDEITSRQPLTEPAASALRRVPRHLFVPHVPLREAYSNSTIVTRRDRDGIATSSSTGPGLMGLMLDQLQVGPGMRVLEIGTGTAYNAALLAELVGPSGHVTTVEITPDVAEDARKALAVAGVANVKVICGDGEQGYAPNAIYDRIIATAGAWEIPPVWEEQLAPDGVLVVPLRMKGLTRSVALRRDGPGVWRSHSVVNCGFMPMQGRGAKPERNIHIAEDMVVRFDDDHDGDARSLAQAATSPGEVVWSGVLIDRPLDLLDFYLADLESLCRIVVSGSVVDSGFVEPVCNWGSMGVATPQALGYLTKRTSSGNPYVDELGVCAYGPGAVSILEDVRARIERWSLSRDAITGVRIEIHPVGQGETTDALMVVDKRQSRVIVRPEPSGV